jgi:hypothetical protein
VGRIDSARTTESRAVLPVDTARRGLSAARRGSPRPPLSSCGTLTPDLGSHAGPRSHRVAALVLAATNSATWTVGFSTGSRCGPRARASSVKRARAAGAWSRANEPPTFETEMRKHRIQKRPLLCGRPETAGRVWRAPWHLTSSVRSRLARGGASATRTRRSTSTCAWPPDARTRRRRVAPRHDPLTHSAARWKRTPSALSAQVLRRAAPHCDGLSRGGHGGSVPERAL